MKKLLLILLCLPIIGFGQLGDYYKSEGHPKAKGLEFEIKTPLGFEQLEADRPNIVQKWIKNPKDNSKTVVFLLLVKDLEVEAQDQKSEWIQYLKSENGVQEMIDMLGGNTSNGKYYVLDTYPALYFENMEVLERMDLISTSYSKIVKVILEKHYLMIQMSAFDKSLLEENTTLFRSLCNSVIFTEQYRK